MGRVKIVDTFEHAKNVRRTFTAKEPREMREYPWTWPTRYFHIGSNLAVAYASDKWKDDGDFELYKHIAESPNQVWCVPDCTLQWLGSNKSQPVFGTEIVLDSVEMPKQIALLGLFEEIDIALHVGLDGDGNPVVGKGNEGCVKVTFAHALLGSGKMAGDRPFLVVYSEPTKKDRGGVHMIIVGEELDVEEDGIVG